MFEYILITVLLMLSFFYSGTETDMSAGSIQLLLELEKSGDKRDKRANKLI